MPTALTTINVAKEQAATYQPLLLAEFTFADGAVLRLSTHPLNTSEGGVQYGGNDYLGRISDQTIQQVQALSETGVDLVPSVSMSIADPAAYIYSNWETAAGRGFKGASLTLRLVFYDVAGGTFSSDSRIPFVGICDKPASDAARLTVTAVAKTSLMRAMLPVVPIQRRCPWINPTTTAQRAEASDEDSCFYECGETRDTTTAPPCSYTLATCTQLTRFGGITYSAPAGMRVREYVSGNWSDVRGVTNEASYGDRIPMLYGKAWIEPPVLTAIPDGNYLRGECIVALGPVTIHKVLVNGIELSPANLPDGTPISGANPDFRYNWINDGTRDGSPNADTPWSGTGDPYGSMSAIMFVLPRSQGGGDGVPRVRVLASRKDLRKYQALASVTVTSNVAVATLVGANVDIASNDAGWAFEIIGTTGASLNGDWTGLTNWTAGPPGTFTFATTGVADGTYTGGYIRFKSATENAAWVIADLLTWTNYRYEDLDLASFCAAAQVLEARPTAIVLRQRRSAAEIIRSIRQAHGLLLVPEHSTGKLHLYVKQTLADQQPATISGSNYDTTVASKTAAGITTSGYVAYKFDAASILRSDLPISLKELPRSASDSPNRISLSFQDRTNDYAISTLSVVDSDDAGRLDGQEIAGSLAVNADGLTSYADAMRSARVNLAEIHRGNTAGDTRGTRVFEWDTTVRGSHLRIGHIVLMTDTLKGLTNQMLRITKIQPSQNYETVRLTAHWHDDNWYTDAYAATGALDATQYAPNPVSDASPLDIGGTVGSNLIRNAGFENGKVQWHGDIDNAAATLVTDEYDSGLQCIRIAATGATEIHQPYWFEDGKYDVMPCAPGEQYVFRGRYKFAAGSAVISAQARIAFYDAAGGYLDAGATDLDTANTDWSDFALTATAPANAKYMGIFPWFGTLTAGAVYLDTLHAARSVTPDFPTVADATVDLVAASADENGIHFAVTVTAPADPNYAGGHVLVERPTSDDATPATPTLPGDIEHVDWFLGQPGESRLIEFTLPLPAPEYLAALPEGKTVKFVVYHLSRAYQYANDLVRLTAFGPPAEPEGHTPMGTVSVDFTNAILAIQDQLGTVDIFDHTITPGLDGQVVIDIAYYPPRIGPSLAPTIGTFVGVKPYSTLEGRATVTHPDCIYEGNIDPLQVDAFSFATLKIPVPDTLPAKVAVQLASYDDSTAKKPQKITWAAGEPGNVPADWGLVVEITEAALTFDANPTGVSTTVHYDEFEQFAVEVGWVAPAPQGGVVGYEAAMEFYEAPFTTPHLFARMGPTQGYDTVSQTSPYKPKPTVATKVKGYVRSFTADGRYSEWVAGDLEDIDLNLSVNVPQPAATDWAIVDPTELNGGYGADQRQQKARLRVNVIAIPAGVDYVTAWLYMDGAWRPMLNADATGNHDIWIDQPKTATTYDCKLVGNRRDAIKMPSAANDIKTFSVAAWALPLAPTAFNVTVQPFPNYLGNGKTWYRLKYEVTLPTDPNRMGVAIFRRWTDATYTPVAGEDGQLKEISWIKSTENSLVWYSSDGPTFEAPKDGIQYTQIAAVPKNYADEYDFGSALALNTSFSPDGGYKSSAFDMSTFNGFEYTGGKLQPKLDPNKGLIIDGSGNLTNLALTALEAWGLSSTDFDGSTPGNLKLNNAVIARLLTQYITLTGEMYILASTGTAGVRLNSSGVLVGNSSQYVDVTSTGVAIKGGGSENRLTSSGMEILVGGVSKVLVASGVTSINGGFQVNSSGTVYFEVMAGAIDCRLPTKIHNGFEYIAGGVTIAAGGKSDWRTALGLVIGTDVAAQSHNHDSAYAAASHTHSWSSITDKPTTFAPSSHSHSFSDVGGGTLRFPETYSEAIALSGITTAGWVPCYNSSGTYLGKIPYFT